jgi:hypothetical protein
MQVNANNAPGSGNINVYVPDVPECPMCRHAIEPAVWGAGLYAEAPVANASGSHPVDVQVVLRCPRVSCRRLFIARYKCSDESPPNGIGLSGRDWDLVDLSPRTHKPKGFPEEVQRVSRRFAEIHDQASAAEESGLDLICGVGYRKALEFLIKDFLKYRTTDEAKQANIEKAQLATCIAYIDDSRLKTTASRAAWLGNDETHYVRKWEDKDLQDLKKLIDLTVYWVSAQILTSELESSMPDSRTAAKG